MGRFTGKKCKLLSMLVMTCAIFMMEIIVGYSTNSMALVADSFHMLSDVIAIGVAFFCVQMSPKKWSRSTYGWARAEVLGALVNSVFLSGLCFTIFVQSLKRLFSPKEIRDPEFVLYVGIFGLAVNVIGLFLFHEHGFSHGHDHNLGHIHGHDTCQSQVDAKSSVLDVVSSDGYKHDSKGINVKANSQQGAAKTHSKISKQQSKILKQQSSASQMNMRGVFLHVLADAFGSIIVIISACVLSHTEWDYRCYIDPFLSIIIVVIILISTWPLMKGSALILLQTVPPHIQIDCLRNRLLQEIKEISTIYELHIWQLVGDRIIATVHIGCHNKVDVIETSKKVEKFFYAEGIHSATIQVKCTTDSKVGHCVLDYT